MNAQEIVTAIVVHWPVLAAYTRQELTDHLASFVDRLAFNALMEERSGDRE